MYLDLNTKHDYFHVDTIDPTVRENVRGYHFDKLHYFCSYMNFENRKA